MTRAFAFNNQVAAGPAQHASVAAPPLDVLEPAATGDAAATPIDLSDSDVCFDCDEADGEGVGGGVGAILTEGGGGNVAAGGNPPAALRPLGGAGKVIGLQSWGGRARLSSPPPSPPPSPAAIAPEAAAGGGLNARAVYIHLLGDALLRGGRSWQRLVAGSQP